MSSNVITVYDINRVRPPKAPGRDDTADPHFVPAPCQVACPVGTDAPSYIGFIWEEKYAEAFEAITATNPFSSICGRVCDAPCEPACRRADSDGPIAIRNLKRYVMDKLGKDHHLPAVQVTRKETVAVVGAGPAGLTAAHDLAEAGFEVHVYEMMDKPGGMMVWGIPAFRLPPGIIEEDMQRLFDHCPGIKLHCGVALGKDVTLDQLKTRHAAVLLTIGSWWGKPMGIAGETHPNVVDGVGFLRRINAGERPILPEKVLVVGGGDVAMDACRAALRLPGVKEVKVVYRRGPKEIPARKEELKQAIEENIEIVYNTLPVSVVNDGGRFALRCVETRMGAPGPDGRRKPETVQGSERDFDCGMVIMAVGQKAELAELEKAGLMAGDRVKTDWNSMRTADPKIFAAGDGAFGGSTIVMAMMHGHRAAHYVKAHLDGITEPLAYRTPYRTRHVAAAQDINWEIFPRREQKFNGLGANPVAFPEIEMTYDDKTAKEEAARCYRCDAETGSADYSVRAREDIFVMARTPVSDLRTQAAILQKHLKPKDNPFPANHHASFEDLVFLPANLSRLVIDPYRDACNVATDLASSVKLDIPVIAAGLDALPADTKPALGAALAKVGSAYLGRDALPGSTAPWLQLIVLGEDRPEAAAAAHVYVQPAGFTPFKVERQPGKLVGLAARASELEKAIPFALERGFDLMLLDGSAGIATGWPELKGHPDFTVLRDAMRILRRMNREEDIDFIYFGGVRSGTDVAKLLGLGAKAGCIGMTMALALGGELGPDGLQFFGDRSPDERIDAAASIINAMSAEASIMARCTGKTDVRNIEPEDLRSITLASARAFGVPLAGAKRGTVIEAAE
ncbi:MAG: FAD-dependent oxidoreductase [Rhizobiales bacterium]|nr:FAD-dependent oxidoreductase [Hyphomicrobiales bacterium]MBI3672456.1 FAD-dependent oxidoreductase [Hyphomicrobiales bacterium]